MRLVEITLFIIDAGFSYHGHQLSKFEIIFIGGHIKYNVHRYLL